MNPARSAKTALPNVQDVAEAAGLSETTVFRALRGDPRVKPATIMRVKKAAEKVRYRRSLVAQAMITRRSYTIGVVLPRLGGFFTQVLAGIIDTANQHDYQVLLYSLENANIEAEKAFTHRLVERMVDGIIIAPKLFESQQREHLQELKDRQIPFVVIDREIDGFESILVVSDDYRGAVNAVQHLIDLGHTRIAHLAGPSAYSTARNRLQAYTDTLTRHGIKPLSDYVITIDDYDQEAMFEQGYKATLALMRLKPAPTALFCVADMLAPGVYRALSELHLKIPSQISVVGYTDIEYAHLLHIPLTTVRQPTYQMGREAMSLLIEHIANPGKLGLQRMFLQNQLIIRDSTGPVPSSRA